MSELKNRLKEAKEWLEVVGIVSESYSLIDELVIENHQLKQQLEDALSDNKKLIEFTSSLINEGCSGSGYPESIISQLARKTLKEIKENK